MKLLYARIAWARAVARQLILFLCVLGTACVLVCGCSRERLTIQPSNSGPIAFQLVAEPTQKEIGQVRLVLRLSNTSVSNHCIVAPTDGSNVKYFCRKLNAKEQTFNSLLLPMDGFGGIELIRLPPGKELSHETILGMDPGHYEVYAQYLSRTGDGVTWCGTAQTAGIFLEVPRTKHTD